jgi:hypothetical protein
LVEEAQAAPRRSSSKSGIRPSTELVFMRIPLHRTSKNIIDGLVLTFLDITK